jgi:hypothetical protein
MFVKFFKDRSNKKFINKVLENRSSSVNNNKIQTVGIILNIGEFKDYDKLRDIFQNYGIKENKIKFIAYVSENDMKLNHWDSYFESKDFGWHGSINNLDLKDFIEMKFDALISYYKKDNLELNYATACSNANFKIGLSNKNQNLNDIIIDINPNFIDIFGKELKKYLDGLNKI